MAWYLVKHKGNFTFSFVFTLETTPSLTGPTISVPVLKDNDHVN